MEGYGEAGLRTLCLSCAELDPNIYDACAPCLALSTIQTRQTLSLSQYDAKRVFDVMMRLRSALHGPLVLHLPTAHQHKPAEEHASYASDKKAVRKAFESTQGASMRSACTK